MEGNDESFFAFRGSFQSRSLNAAAGRVKFQIGTDVSRRRVYGRPERTVTIFGKWKPGRALALEFEVTYSGQRRRSFNFGIQKVLREKNRIKVSLRGAGGRDLGVDVVFTRRSSENIEFFLELGHSSSESRAMAGLKAKF